jgi:hypothetical protein
MGWFKRLFGLEKPQEQAQPMTQVVQEAAQAQSIDPAKVGPEGTFDESGLAKRVALAFDGDPEVADIDTVWLLSSAARLFSKVKLRVRKFSTSWWRSPLLKKAQQTCKPIR